MEPLPVVSGASGNKKGPVFGAPEFSHVRLSGVSSQ
jgi:hypothetical protein